MPEIPWRLTKKKNLVADFGECDKRGGGGIRLHLLDWGVKVRLIGCFVLRDGGGYVVHRTDMRSDRLAPEETCEQVRALLHTLIDKRKAECAAHRLTLPAIHLPARAGH